jgi:chemotaxis protein methyltransferase CheR
MQQDISKSEFKLLKEYIYNRTGITLSEQKVSLLKSRLSKRLRALNLKSFQEYYDFLIKNEAEYTDFVNAVSTNVTSFFREEKQWDFLSKVIRTMTNDLRGKLRIWSSASSTGEEPYTIGMFLKESLKDFNQCNIKILATDISHDALTKAKNGIYQDKMIGNLKKHHVVNNFTRIGKTDQYVINKEIKDLVMFREFNLVYGDFSIFGKTQFDLIFCRNVMIYFDTETKVKIVNNLSKQLKKGGYFFLGHSESLMNHPGLKYVMPSIYQKI